MKYILILVLLLPHFLKSQQYLGLTYSQCAAFIDYTKFDISTTKVEGENVFELWRKTGDYQELIQIVFMGGNSLMSGKSYQEKHVFENSRMKREKTRLKLNGYKFYGFWMSNVNMLFTIPGTFESCLLIPKDDHFMVVYRNDIEYVPQE